MKATRMDVLHKCTVPVCETDLDAAPKVYVDQITAGGIFITSVEPTNGGGDITGFFEYLPGTVPENAIVTEATANTASIRIRFIAEPKNTLFGVDILAEWENGAASQVAQSVTQRVNDSRVYEGYVDVVVNEELLTEQVKLISSTGSEAIVDLKLLIGGPTITAATLGVLPGTQTTLKQGDTISVSGTVGNDAVSISALNYGVSSGDVALTLGAEDSAGVGFRTFSGNLTGSNRTGSLPARIIAENQLGTEGDMFDSTTVVMEQTKPVIGNASFTYPVGQEAIKASESVGLAISIGNADDYAYTVAAGLTVSAPNSFEATKIVTRSDETIQYSVGNNNLLTVTATRNSNASVTIKNFDLNVVNTAPSATLSFLGNPGRLRSSADGENYTLQVTPSQPLLNAPTNLIADANAGDFTGNWSKSGQNYRHALNIKDTHDRGSHVFTLLEITGLSGIVANTITGGETYTIGGFTSRIIVMPALQQFTDIGTAVLDFNKVRAQYVGSDELTRENNTTQLVKGFTITDASGAFDTAGNQIFLTDGNFAGTNTTGTLQIEVEELA